MCCKTVDLALGLGAEILPYGREFEQGIDRRFNELVRREFSLARLRDNELADNTQDVARVAGGKGAGGVHLVHSEGAIRRKCVDENMAKAISRFFSRIFIRIT